MSCHVWSERLRHKPTIHPSLFWAINISNYGEITRMLPKMVCVQTTKWGSVLYYASLALLFVSSSHFKYDAHPTRHLSSPYPSAFIPHSLLLSPFPWQKLRKQIVTSRHRTEHRRDQVCRVEPFPPSESELIRT